MDKFRRRDSVPYNSAIERLKTSRYPFIAGRVIMLSALI